MSQDISHAQSSGPKAHLVLADGTAFSGIAIGAAGTTIGEAVFTTGMTGYQEVLTDPSYRGQIVAMTATQMGNTGVNTEDTESIRPHVAGFVVHELARLHSNWRSQLSLDAYLNENGIATVASFATTISTSESMTVRCRSRRSEGHR